MDPTKAGRMRGVDGEVMSCTFRFVAARKPDMFRLYRGTGAALRAGAIAHHSKEKAHSG